MVEVPLQWAAMVCDRQTNRPVPGAKVTLKSTGTDIVRYTALAETDEAWVNISGSAHTGEPNTSATILAEVEAASLGVTETFSVGWIDAGGLHWTLNQRAQTSEDTLWLQESTGTRRAPLRLPGSSRSSGGLGSQGGATTSAEPEKVDSRRERIDRKRDPAGGRGI